MRGRRARPTAENVPFGTSPQAPPAGVYMEQCVHALKMCALRPLRETTYLRVQVHVTAYVAPAVADAPQRYIRHAHVRTCQCAWCRSPERAAPLTSSRQDVTLLIRVLSTW